MLSLTASHANKTPDLVIAGVTDSLKENIEENPDLQTILESKNLVFNPIKIEKQVKSLLYLEGYFDAFLNLTYNEPNNIYNITIDAGQQYKVSSIEIDEPSSVFTPYHLIKIRKDDLFDGHKLVKAEKNILEFLTGTECRYIKRVKHIVKLNEFEKTADIIFDVGVSPSSVFGTSRFDGVENIHLDFFKPLLQYEKGACYTEQDINATIKEAINTNLFDNIYYEIDPHKKNAEGVAVVDVIYQVNERKHRTFNYGFGVSDTEAFIFSAGNQWRNLFNRGVTLDIQTRLSDRSQTLD
ncbi:MAG: translocation and assembly module TamA, partial [Alphaproteobacteria bacterium]